jgi:hypothetical protein
MEIIINILYICFKQNLGKMTAIELKKLLIDKITEINDVSFLNAMKTILETKTQPQTLVLNSEQLFEIQESKKEIKEKKFIEQAELEEKMDKWLSVK